MENQKGRAVKGYELQKLIGSGGFGAVYRAHQSVIDREVAIKVILPDHANDPHFIRTFESEAQLIARLEHPYIVPLYDFWRDPEGAYLVMRYYPAGNLSQLIHQGGAMEMDDALRMFEQVASALDAAHMNQIIHRDIKPANILLDIMGNAYLSDFGLAEDISDEDDNADMAGSPAYIPPEIIQAQMPTAQSDLYSLGFVLFEMLTGRYAFAEITPDSSIGSILDFHLNTPIPDSLSLPDEVNQIIQRATAKDPADRYDTAMDMVRALREAIHGEHDATNNNFSIAPEYIVNPFKGLRAFDEADEFAFFGRDKLVKRLLQRLDEDHATSNFLALVGPSGSGKSSVVHAGLVPALRRGELSGSDEWFILDMVPGDNPFKQLVAALRSIALDPLAGAERDLMNSADALQTMLPRVVPASDDNVMLVIDQFEELFTQTEDVTVRRQFLDLLYTSLESEHFYLVIMLRADFYDRPMLHEGFGTLIQERTQVVLPLTSMELNQVIKKPAEYAGLEIDETLTAAIIADVQSDTVTLPLLQYALTEVFERRDENRLTFDGYEAIGGIAGALAYRADEIYNQLDAQQQDIARQVFLRFVTLGEGTEDTRRRARRSELQAVVGDNQLLQPVLDAFGQARLLTFDNDEETREPTVEVAHEALIREWTRLRDWLDASRDDIRRQRVLASTVQQWLNAGKDRSYLLRGTQLNGIEHWRSESSIELTSNETEFIASSIAAREELDKLETERQQHEAELEARSRDRLRQLIAVFGIAALVAIGLSIFAFSQTNVAQTALADAQLAEQEAESAALSGFALSEYQQGNRQLALALALDAANSENPAPIVEEVLLEISRGPGEIYDVPASEFPIEHFVLAPDSNTAIFAAGLNVSQYSNLLENSRPSGQGQQPPGQGGSPPGQGGPPPGQGGPPPGQGGVPPGQGGSPPGRGSAPPTQATAEFTTISLMDLTTRITGTTAMMTSSFMTDMLFVPRKDGAILLITASDDGQIAIWDYETQNLIREQHIGSGYIKLSTTDNGQILLVSASGNNNDGMLARVDLDTGETLGTHTVDSSFAVARMSGDGDYVVGLFLDRRITTWDAETWEEITTFDTEGVIRPSAIDIVLHPVEQTVVVTTEEEILPYYDYVTGQYLGGVRVVSTGTHTFTFNQDGTRLVAISRDSTLTVWDFEQRFLELSFTAVETMATNIAYNNLNDTVYVVTNTGDVRAYSILGDPADLLGSIGENDAKDGVWISDTEIIIAYRRQDAALVKVNIESGETTLLADLPDNAYSLSRSPDSRYILALEEPFDPLKKARQFVIYDLETNRILDCDFCEPVFNNNPNGTPPLPRDEADIRAIFLNQSPNQILVAHWNRAELRSLDDGAILWEKDDFSTNITEIASSPDGTLFAIGLSDSTMVIIERATGEIIYEYATEDIDTNFSIIEFAPDNSYLVVAEDGSDEVILVDIVTGEEFDEIAGHDGEVTSATIFADGRHILTTSSDTTAILWTLGSQDELPPEFDHDISVLNAALSPDESQFVSFPEDLKPMLWSLEELTLAESIEWATQNRVARPLTEAECRRFVLGRDCEESEEEHEDDDDD